MNNSRKALYNNILNSVKNSPIQSIEFEGNTYHFKLDYKLPYGECHYSRIFAKLIYYKECLGIIKPGDVLLETTSGSGGRAAAAVATALGYKIKIAVPAGGERAREIAIEKAGGEICLTPKEAYVNGFPEFVKSFLKANPGTKYINHVMGDVTGRGVGINGVAIEAFRPFVEEVIEAGISPDVVICPLGNGTTTLPMVTGFKSLFNNVQVIGFESVASAFAHRRLRPGKYENIFGMNPEIIGRHDLPGTTPATTIFPVPAMEQAALLLDGVGLVTSDYVNQLFLDKVGFLPTDKSRWVIKWDDLQHDDITEFGRTGRAGFATAIKYAQMNNLTQKQFLIPVFDAAWHYDS